MEMVNRFVVARMGVGGAAGREGGTAIKGQHGDLLVMIGLFCISLQWWRQKLYT